MDYKKLEWKRGDLSLQLVLEGKKASDLCSMWKHLHSNGTSSSKKDEHIFTQRKNFNFFLRMNSGKYFTNYSQTPRTLRSNPTTKPRFGGVCNFNPPAPNPSIKPRRWNCDEETQHHQTMRRHTKSACEVLGGQVALSTRLPRICKLQVFLQVKMSLKLKTYKITRAEKTYKNSPID